AEAAVDRALGGIGEDVAGAILGAGYLAARIAGDGGVGGRQVVDIEQVVLEQRGALQREGDQTWIDAQGTELDRARPREPDGHSVAPDYSCTNYRWKPAFPAGGRLGIRRSPSPLLWEGKGEKGATVGRYPGRISAQVSGQAPRCCMARMASVRPERLSFE